MIGMALVLLVGDACGGSAPTSPSPSVVPTTPAPSPSPPLAAAALTLDVASKAEFTTGQGGEPGRISYQNCFEMSVPDPMMATTALTLERVEHSTIGPDETVYDRRLESALAGRRMGGAVTGLSHGSIVGCPIYTDFDLVRPTASIYRLTIDYVLDSASPAIPVRATADADIAANLPARPIMTGVTIGHDLADMSSLPQGVPPITFVAAGQGGQAPYEYRWLYSGTTLLRDWNSSSIFVWDGLVNGQPTTPSRVSSIFVQARRAGSAITEVSNRVQVLVVNP